MGFSATCLGQSKRKAPGTLLQPHKVAAVPDNACKRWCRVGKLSADSYSPPGAGHRACRSVALTASAAPGLLAVRNWGDNKPHVHSDQMGNQTLESKFANGQPYSSCKCSIPVKAKHFQCQVLLVTAMMLTPNMWAPASRLLRTCHNRLMYKKGWESTSWEFQCSLWKCSAYKERRYF